MIMRNGTSPFASSEKEGNTIFYYYQQNETITTTDEIDEMRSRVLTDSWWLSVLSALAILFLIHCVSHSHQTYIHAEDEKVLDVAVNINNNVTLDVLFVLHDAGETFATLPVMDFLHQAVTNGSMNITYGALVMSTAQSLTSNRTDVITFQDLGLNTNPLDPDHNATLSAHDLELINQQLHPRLVITGMDSVFQQQISELYYYNTTAVVAGYLDGYSWDPPQLS